MLKRVAIFLLLAAPLLATSCSGVRRCDASREGTNLPADVAASERVREQLSGEDPMTESPAQREQRLVADARERPLELARWRNPVSSWDCPGMPGPPQHGRVLATDNEANVHVISYGAEDGVMPGSSYIVSRGMEYIATIKIIEVQAKQSAGNAFKRLSEGAIRRGDKVIRGD